MGALRGQMDEGGIGDNGVQKIVLKKKILSNGSIFTQQFFRASENRDEGQLGQTKARRP